MAGLTEQERQEILSRRQAKPSVPGMLPPGMVPQGMTLGSRPSLRLAPDPVEVERQKQLMKIANPIPTESERERSRLEESAVRFLEQFEQKLGVDRATGTVKNAQLMTPTRTFIPAKFQEYVQTEDELNAYNDLDSAFSVGVIALTGRQGDVEKLRQLQDIYSFGGGMRNKPASTIAKIDNLKRLFSTIENPQSSNEEIDQQMNVLMGEADPNIKRLQQQFPGATIRRKP